MQPLRQEEATGSARSTPPAVTSLEVLEHLEKAMNARLGTLREGANPLVAEIREHLEVLEPGPAGQLPPPKELSERQAKLSAALDQLEDVLEGLYLAAHGIRPLAPGREG